MHKTTKLNKIDSLFALAGILLANLSAIWIGALYSNTLLVIAFALYFLIYKRNKINWKINISDTKRIFAYWIIGFLLNIVISLIAQGLVSSRNQEIIVDQLNKGGMQTTLTLVAILIFAPVMEEIIFRGLIQEWLGKINKIMALIITTLAFGGLHLMASFNQGRPIIKMLIELLPYVTISFVFSYYYYKTENLWQCIVLHFVNNAMAAILLLVGNLI